MDTGGSKKQRGIKQEFSFDKVFSPKVSQEEIFEELSLFIKLQPFLLQTLTYNMDTECRVAKNTTQNLKTNIKVLCRVRPRTPKEIEQMKALFNINIIDECTIEVRRHDT